MEPEVGAWVQQNNFEDIWYHLLAVDRDGHWVWTSYSLDGNIYHGQERQSFGDTVYWSRTITRKEMENPFAPEPQQRELVAYVKFFTNARGQLAVAAALTPDALHRANMVDPANELKRLKIKTTV